ncbi:MAG: aldehyde dehydrogenase family protein [Syntrophobacteraceae bacterium]|jgi:aldehyde dehydrogenase (NAD+)|nr:aldehyde dehydrogenase family protein [Syntrophobacteraceae bacterium]
MPVTEKRREILETLDLGGLNPGACAGSRWLSCRDHTIQSISPVDGQVLAEVCTASESDYEEVASSALKAFHAWRMIPAPRRGEIVRQIRSRLRLAKQELAQLITLENGKILAEAEGEVQEMIDICDFAIGLSRMLYGSTMHSERPGHRLYEQWHPLGPIGVITAFNFPMAVWSWNAMIALVAGDTVVWKPSSKVPLCALALSRITCEVLQENGLPEGILNVIIGEGETVGERLVADPRMRLISATGSVAMGRRVGRAVMDRLGRPLLELGGNNGVIVAPSADLGLATRAILFGAVGTAGQRCTTLRRLIVHDSIHEAVMERLVRAYKQVRIGNPFDKKTIMGPLIDREAVDGMQAALEIVKNQGGRIRFGGEVLRGGLYSAGTYVSPCIVEVERQLPIVLKETFAPLLYVMTYHHLEEAIEIHNGVPQGLSSSIFTNDLREAERFLSASGSDCGIANVNLSTSGAEIGGAFGGEKDTGGGRESGSDAWKAYMRRQTNTINWSGDMPLAQGIEFGEFSSRSES